MILQIFEPKVSLFRLIMSTAALIEPTIACHLCGYDYVHIVNVFIAMNKKCVAAKDDDGTVIRTTKRSSHLGSGNAVTFAGEYVHQFECAFALHKGNTQVELVNIVNIPQGKSFSKLWRD